MKQTVDWSGIYPAALTMFGSAGRLDEAATASHVDRLVREGARGIVVGGTSGEFASMDDDERLRVIEIVVAAVATRVPVVAGTGCVSTDATIRLTKRAAAVGADGAIVILPYYMRPTEPEVFEHFRRVGEASPIPVMIYNNPANSGAPALDASALSRLYRDGHAQGVKSTFPTVHQIHEARAETDDGFRVFYGSFTAPLEAMAGGAHGWISGILNVVTTDGVELWKAMQVADLNRAREVWRRIMPIKQLYTRKALGLTSDLAIYRGILRLRGHAAGYCRAPLLDLTSEQLERLRVLLEPAGLLRVGG